MKDVARDTKYTEEGEVGRDQRKMRWNLAEKVMVEPQNIESCVYLLFSIYT